MNATADPNTGLDDVNARLADLDATGRVAWALANLPGTHVLTTSFGIQAAASLHLLTQIRPDMPIVLIDTGYLFPETYRFADALTARLQLRLNVYRADPSPAWQEARFGQLWTQGSEGITRYNQINKVAPMRRAFEALQVGTWFSGLRREQSQSRAETPFVEFKNGRYKVHPIADWSSRDVQHYLQHHDLPFHPLWEQGYVSVGDVHTTRPLEPGMSEEETRFFGLKRECGLHIDV